MWQGKVILGSGNSIHSHRDLKCLAQSETQQIHGQGREGNETILFLTIGNAFLFKINCLIVKWIQSVEKSFLCKMKMPHLLIFLDLALIFLSGDVKMKIKFFLCHFFKYLRHFLCPFKFCVVFFLKDQFQSFKGGVYNLAQNLAQSSYSMYV